ncbi:hypothetical protein MMC25_000761 [Agyrium rufum]|nr:hypothetical protein [Agyrium rufum]
MALAYCWGLIQAIYLMGHGLVAVPRKLFRHANISGRLRRIQVHAPKVYEKLEDSITELAELEEQLSQLRQKRSGVTRNHQEWIEDMVDLSSLTSADQSLLAAAAAAPPPNVITDRYLADLNRRLIRARHKRQRFADQWQRHVQEAVDTQAIIDATASRKLEMTKLDDKPVQRAWIKLSPSLRYYLHAKILPGIDMFFGGLFSIASCFIVWSEVFKNIAPKLSIIRLTVIRHESSDRGKVGFTGQLIASLWIFYMIASALTSFNDVKIWGNRALTRRNTYGESACWYAGQVAKLTVPLSYNFITFLPKEIYQETTFFKFLGRLIVLTPLGKGFDYFFPIFILVPVCATLFNLYGRVRDVFGFGIPVDDEEGENSNPTGYGTGGWREGRDLIEQEVRGRTNLTGTSTPLSNSNGGRSQQLPNERGNAAIVDPLLRVARSERPARSVSPAVGRNTNTTSSNRPAAPISQRSEISRRQAERLAAATEAAEEEDENAFSGFAHRVRNTLDRVERPEWLPDVGKRPKWMGGGDDATGGGGSQAGGGGSTGIGRWFGRPAEGKVRL